ncbi:MAG: hypothetical protein R2698_02015 [Microthrixaceae bacterium]
MRAMFSTWSINDEPAGHMDGYVAESFDRFLHTWGLCRRLSGRALELGSNPYFTTELLTRWTDLDVWAANYFRRGPGSVTETLRYVAPDGEAVVRSVEAAQFNIERDRFPSATAASRWCCAVRSSSTC